MGTDIGTIQHQKSEQTSDIETGFAIDVSFDSDNGVFRRYLVSNNPVNRIDPKGLEWEIAESHGVHVPYGYTPPKLDVCPSDNPCQLICNGLLYLPRIIIAGGAYAASGNPGASTGVMIGSAPISTGVCYFSCGGRLPYAEFGRSDIFDSNGNYMGFGGP